MRSTPPLLELSTASWSTIPAPAPARCASIPELKWRWSESELERLAAQAVRLLAGAAVAVAPGGLLAAISCSLEPEENEAVGERFLALVAGFRRTSAAGRIPAVAAAALSGEGLWRWLPAGDHDGFTVQLFERLS